MHINPSNSWYKEDESSNLSYFNFTWVPVAFDGL